MTITLKNNSKGEGLPQDKEDKGENDAVMTIDELSEYLKISKSSLYKLAQEGSLPGAKKVGRHWRFYRETIDKWMGES